MLTDISDEVFVPAIITIVVSLVLFAWMVLASRELKQQEREQYVPRKWN